MTIKGGAHGKGKDPDPVSDAFQQETTPGSDGYPAFGAVELAVVGGIPAQMTRPNVFAVLFVAYGLAASLSLALLMPPFGNGDEVAHLMRADMISGGAIVGSRHGVHSAGGPIDLAIFAAYDPFLGVMYHPGSPVTRALDDAMASNGLPLAHTEFLRIPCFTRPPATYRP